MSNPKQKANEIITKHYFILFDSDSDKGQEALVSSLAKKSALVTIDEILKTHEKGKDFDSVNDFAYWSKVRIEAMNH